MRSIKHKLVPFLAIVLLTGCSVDRDDDEKNSSIDQATKKVADAAVEYIQTPINKAEAVKEIEESRNERLQEQAQ